MERRNNGVLLWVVLCCGSALAVGCQSDSWSDLGPHCDSDWDLYGAPNPECVAVFHDHLGVDASEWTGAAAADLRDIERAVWAVAFAPVELPTGTRRMDVYNAIASVRSTQPCPSSYRAGVRSMCLSPNPGLAFALSDLIHEGAHSQFGGHPVQGRFDDSRESPYGWAMMFNRQMAILVEQDYGEFDAIEFHLAADNDASFLRLR